MPFPQAMKVAAGLVAQIEAAAALAARLGAPDAPLAPGVDEAAKIVVNHLDPGAFDDLTADEARIIHGFLRSFLHQAVDLIRHPGRGAGWSFDDPVILNQIGQVSRTVARGLAALAAEEPDLAERLKRQGRFLGAGTGVGWIAIDVARSWPTLRVTGLDIFDRALPRLFSAVEPGGWLAFGIFDTPADPLPRALPDLRLTRFGGQIWTVDDVRTAMAAAGFILRYASIAVQPARLIIGRRPAH